MLYKHITISSIIASLLATILNGCELRSPRPPTPPSSTIQSIRLERSGCYGSCPAYTLIYWSDGTVVFRGFRFVPRLGTFVGHVDFATVAAWVDGEDPDKYAGSYGMGWIDAPRLRLTIDRSARTTSIVSDDEAFLPVSVKGAVAALDGFAEYVQWDVVSSLDPVMGYFVHEDGHRSLTGIAIYPGGSPTRVEVDVTVDEPCSKGGYLYTTAIGDIDRIGRSPETYAGEVKGTGPSPNASSPISIRAHAGRLDVTFGTGTAAYARTDASGFDRMAEELPGGRCR